jgi:uncharacterized protein (TIGR02453 family)
MPTHFTPEALKFLRSLARHNDRAWFDPRKPIYERELKAPMLALIAEIDESLAGFAPAHVRPPHKAMLRIYRDTRFSADKLPYKTQIAAWWSYAGPRMKMPKTSGAGFYFSLSATELTIAAGCFMPTPDQLLAVRRYLANPLEAHHLELRRLLADKKLRAAAMASSGEREAHRLTRPPRGFAADSPAIDLILCRQWGVAATLPAGRATLPTLRQDIVSRFALAAPIVQFLNTPILLLNAPKLANAPKIAGN